jgi:uncharacterized integral membrane protein (TIGR00698 family)
MVTAQESHLDSVKPESRGVKSSPVGPPGSLRNQILFLIGLVIASTGIISPPFALLGGIVYGLAVVHPLKKESSALARLLLQASVVALGFGMDLNQVVHAGRSGFVYTALGIVTAMVLGVLVGRLLRVSARPSFLITAGTAICGGSAIAALAPITQATEDEISVSMGTVFLLNSIALLVFPAIGYALHLTQNQFGLWAALAIHDTSSVVGASAKFGNQALAVGTTVKLARALWIVPVSLLTAAVVSRQSERSGLGGLKPKIKVPWFILFFCLAAAAKSYIPVFSAAYLALSHLGKAGLTATLFLIGTGLSWNTLKQVGVRPLVQGVILWILVGTASLAAIWYKLISI